MAHTERAQEQHVKPLLVNPQTGEVYLRLPPPHEHIILTPPRVPSDIGPIVILLNDHRVYNWMSGPPHPYLPVHAETWLEGEKAITNGVLADLRTEAERNGDNPGELGAVKGCPLRIIREVNEAGPDTLIGFLGLYVSERGEIDDEEERLRVVEEESRKEAGDPTLVYDLACMSPRSKLEVKELTKELPDYLSPSHHRRGIMSAAISAVLQQWAVPRMRARTVRGWTFEDNEASNGILIQQGFVALPELSGGSVEVRGETRRLAAFEWKGASVSPQQ